MKVSDAVALATIILALIILYIAFSSSILSLLGSKAFASAISGDFSLTLFATFVSALAGAYGAQIIAEKNKRKDVLVEEIRNTNAAIILAFAVCNSCLTLKKQQVLDLKNNYDSLKTEVLVVMTAASRSGATPPIAIQMDFRTLSPITLPTETLQRTVFNKLSPINRVLVITTTLIQLEKSLNHVIELRNNLIKSFQVLKSPSEKMKQAFYFGFPDENGRVDTSYPDTVAGIYNLCDDCIYYSQALCKDLTAHGEVLKKKFGKEIRISKIDFSLSADLLPPKDAYASFEAAFIAN